MRRVGFCKVMVILGLVLGSILSSRCAAESREPPFEAVVRQDDVLVRSGAGDDIYYPTSKLKKDDRVKVVREDIGGWYLIEPPDGSHSWIPQQFVEMRGGNRGVIKESTYDRIGSELIKDRLDARHKVMRGETVEVLGEEDLTTERGVVRMLKIRPPRGEYRYINKRDVVPDNASSALAPKREENIFNELKKDPESAAKKKQRLPSSSIEGVSVPEVVKSSPSKSLAEPEDLTALDSLPAGTINAYERLGQIDHQFHEMVKRPVETWQLATVRDQYQELQDAPQLADLNYQREVQRRMSAMSRFEKNYANYLDVLRIMNETEARDESIRQQFLAERQIVSTPQSPMTRVFREISKPAQQQGANTQTAQQPKWTPPAQQQQQQQGQPSRRSGGVGVTLPGPQMGGGASITRRFDAAGVVQKAALNRPGLPKYVLLAPNGHVLTYLEGVPGVDLDQSIGRSVGIFGQRSFRADIDADFTIVNRLMPVILKP